MRGSAQAKIDEKGRLKLPASYRADIESEWKTPAVYLTCDDSYGQYVRIYPMPVWQEIEAALRKMGTTAPVPPPLRALDQPLRPWRARSTARAGF